MTDGVSATGAILFSCAARTVLGRFTDLCEDDIEAVCSMAHLGPALVVCVGGIPGNDVQFVLGVSDRGPVSSLISQDTGADRTEPLDSLNELVDEFPECDIEVRILVPDDSTDIPQGMYETALPFLGETPPGWMCLGISDSTADGAVPDGSEEGPL